MSHPVPTHELDHPDTKYERKIPSNVENEFGNIIDCICEKKVVGQGWVKGKWHEGVVCEPSSHQDDCPKFEDYSVGESHEQEA